MKERKKAMVANKAEVLEAKENSAEYPKTLSTEENDCKSGQKYSIMNPYPKRKPNILDG
jgi:hypothetical protein